MGVSEMWFRTARSFHRAQRDNIGPRCKHIKKLRIGIETSLDIDNSLREPHNSIGIAIKNSHELIYASHCMYNQIGLVWVHRLSW